MTSVKLQTTQLNQCHHGGSGTQSSSIHGASSIYGNYFNLVLHKQRDHNVVGNSLYCLWCSTYCHLSLSCHFTSIWGVGRETSIAHTHTQTHPPQTHTNSRQNQPQSSYSTQSLQLAVVMQGKVW